MPRHSGRQRRPETLSNVNDHNLKKAQELLDMFLEVISTSGVTEDAFERP